MVILLKKECFVYKVFEIFYFGICLIINVIGIRFDICIIEGKVKVMFLICCYKIMFL